jgi:hypothetical protein
MKLLGVGVADKVEPELIVEADGVDDQGVVVPVPY